MSRILMLLRTIINTIDKNILFLLTFLFLCSCQPAKDLTIKRQLFVFGTVVDVVIWSDDETSAHMAVNEISEQFNQMHHQWHAWKPGRLQNINEALRLGQTVTLSDEEVHVLKSSLDLSQLSHGHFNPLIGEVINLWGFHADEFPLTTPPPLTDALARLLNDAPVMDDIVWMDNQIFSNNPSVWFDLGGVAKGYAVDLAIGILQSYGLNNAIINAGGDLRAIGNKGGHKSEQLWTIAIQSPKDWQALATIKVDNNEAIFTSGNYRRYKKFDGQRYAHIIDPSTYQPVSKISSATVITQNGMLADAAATALVVAGDQWFQVAQAMGIESALVISENNQCFATKSMLKRLSDTTITCESPKILTGGL